MGRGSIIVLAVLACATVARAQVRTASRVDQRHRELPSIDEESRWATGLYIAGVVVHVGGLAAAIGGSLANICISFGGGGCASAREARDRWLIGGFTVSGIGLAMIGVAIGLDVDSGNRRRALGLRRASELQLRVSPTQQGLMLGVSGTF